MKREGSSFYRCPEKDPTVNLDDFDDKNH
jgi:hypothetical protein